MPGGVGGAWRHARNLPRGAADRGVGARERGFIEADPQGHPDHTRDGVGEAAEPGPRRRPGEGPRQGGRRGDQGGHRARPADPLERHLMARPRRVLVTLESRATFGYSVNVIKRAIADPALEVQTLLTGMHLMPELGNSQSMLHRAQIPISATVPLTPGTGRAGWPQAMGHAISGFAEAYDRLDPEIVLISGDRAETFALAVAAVYMGLPVAHIQAGDKSGHIDDAARMALAKLVHIHLAPGADAVERLRRLGEQEFRIFDTGAPQLDDMVGRSFKRNEIKLDGKNFDLTQPYIVLIQHPVMHEHGRITEQIESTLRACFAVGMAIVWIYPNSDFGFRDIL